MSRFTVSAIDPRKLSMQFFQIARQHPGRREHVHGRIHEQFCSCKACSKDAA